MELSITIHPAVQASANTNATPRAIPQHAVVLQPHQELFKDQAAKTDGQSLDGREEMLQEVQDLQESNTSEATEGGGAATVTNSFSFRRKELKMEL